MSSPQSADSTGDPIRVLVYDDDPGFASALAEVAQTYGFYHVTIADNPASALRLLRGANPIHICLHDLGIRDEHGNELRVLQECAHRIPCILLTGRESTAVSFDSARLGAVECLLKPLGFETIAKRVNYWFMRRMLCGTCDMLAKERMRQLCDVVLERCPATVSEWAMMASITTDRVKQLCHGCLGAPAGRVLTQAREWMHLFDEAGLHWGGGRGNS